MKAVVAEKVKGSLVLPSIRVAAFTSGQTFEFGEDQYNQTDIQDALRKKQIILLEGKAKLVKTVSIKNVGNSSVSIPESIVGPKGNITIKHVMLRSGESKDISFDLLDNHEIKRLRGAFLIEVDGKSEKKAKTTKKTVKKKDSKKKVIRKKHITEDDLLLSEPDDEDDIAFVDSNTKQKDIIFVDIEQVDKRLAQHPKLGKK